MRNPRVSNLPKFLVVGAIFYILMPVDAIPDVAPVIGWLDDLAFLIGALSLLFGAAPKGEKSPDPSPVPKGPIPKGPIIDIKAEPKAPEASQ